MGSISEWGRSPGGEHGNPLQYSCLKNSMDRGAWWATVHGVTKSQAQLKQHSTHACMGERGGEQNQQHAPMGFTGLQRHAFEAESWQARLSLQIA